ncbi:MAG: hypothetical protein IKI29_03520, partial [Clostridia bacterium]|nr:hypothetical protein [Clostridia bacterium]
QMFDLFDKDNNLGLIFPETFSPLERQAVWGGNLLGCKALLEKLRIIGDLPQDPVFPVGNMFWAKTDAVRALFALGLKQDDFPKEAAQTNSTIAHCIERCWTFIAADYKFTYKKVFNNVLTPVVLPDKKRVAFYVHFNKNNDHAISDTDLQSLQVYRSIFDETVFISNSPLNDEAMEKIQPLTSKIILRKNVGFDFGGWKQGMEEFGYDRLKEYDEVAIINNSTFCPLYDLKSVFSEMESRKDDFWGITLFPAIKEKKYLQSNGITEHLQSFFVVFGKKVLQSGELKNFFDHMGDSNNFINAVKNGEVALTAYLRKCGFTYSPYLMESYYICNYLNDYRLPYTKPLSLVQIGCPFVKKKAYDYMPEIERIALENFVEKMGKKLN